MMKKILLALLCVFLATDMFAQKKLFFNKELLNGVYYRTRIGYEIGGTMPIGLPATLRKLNSYTLQPNWMLGIEAIKPFKYNWSLIVGLRLENKGMLEDAKVKNYHMEIVRNGESLEGMFTGDVETKVSEWMFTLPIQANYNFTKKFSMRFGPYASYVLTKSFTGNAHDGYLRVGNPTGSKVILGHTKETHGSYDFSEYMRTIQFGVNLGADLLVYRNLGAFIDLSWGLSDLHHSSFTTIEQTLYPIFGTLGITYTL